MSDLNRNPLILLLQDQTFLWSTTSFLLPCSILYMVAFSGQPTRFEVMFAVDSSTKNAFRLFDSFFQIYPLS